jgi:hypothetical protein
MNMKNFYKVLFATLIIGLLVMTGCSNPFDPPAAPAKNGKGTLVLSINGADGRTILPSTRLDKYELDLLVYDDGDDDYVAYDGEYPKELVGASSTAISLDPGIYKVVIRAFIDDEMVANGEQDGLEVTADASASLNITLEPYGTGNGSFSWDFDVIGVATVAVEIYDIEDPQENFAEDDGEEKAATVELAIGVYDVGFTVTTTEGGQFAWREVLYIYAGLTSVYGNSNLITHEVVKSIYDVPAAGPGYFYLDLNNWQTVATQIQTTKVEGTLAADGLTAKFTLNNQRLNIKLAYDQVAAMQKSKGPINVTIVGESIKEEVGNMRYHLADPHAGGSWNATSGSGNRPFTPKEGEEDTIDPGLADDDGVSISQTFNANKSAATVSYLILQYQGAGTTAEPADEQIKIKSIRIDYPISEPEFYLDLSKANDLSTFSTDDPPVPEADAVSPTLATATFENDVLTATFNADNQRLDIPLTPAQIALLPDAGNVWVTIWGSADVDTQFRYHLGFITSTGGWNATAGGGANNTAFSGMASATGTTLSSSVSDGSIIKYFILQQRAAATTTVTISKIRIDWEKRELPPAVPATEDLVVFKAVGHWEDENGDPAEEEDPGAEWVWDTAPLINSTAITTNWQNLTELSALSPVTFPTGLDIRSYTKFTVRVKYYLEDGETEATIEYGKQWAQIKIDGIDFYNLGEDNASDTNCTINAPIPFSKIPTAAGKSSIPIQFESRNTPRNNAQETGTVSFVELHEFVFYK